METLEK